MGLVTDPYTFADGPGNTASGLQVNQRFDTLYNLVGKSPARGNIEPINMSAATVAQLGLNDGTTVRRGKSIIATEESRTNVAYGTLTTPDQVSSVVLPTDGLIVVGYRAMFKSSVSDVGRAALFIGANRLKVQGVDFGGAPEEQAAVGGFAANVYSLLTTAPVGLVCDDNSTAYTGHVTSGQALVIAGAKAGFEVGGTIRLGADQGGMCVVVAAAGTYDISVQFKSSSGSVTVKERKLWVQAIGF